MKSKRGESRLPAIGLGALLMVGCSPEGQVVSPVLDEGQIGAAIVQVAPVSARGIEAEFVALEQRLPGFGGFFMEDGKLVAFVPDATNASAKGLVTAEFLGTEEGRNRLSDATGRVPEVELRRGEYSISQLLGWKALLRSRGGIEHGVVEFDADERRNRVSVGVLGEEQVGAVVRLAESNGIPAAVLNVYVLDSRPVAAASLTDKVRPLVAGYRTNNSWFSGQYCSLGHPVTLSGTSYFLTASHCIPNYTGGTGGDVYQDGNDISEKVGDIASNPAWSTSGCSAGVDYCSNADAALVDVDAGITASKKVAQSSSVGTGNNAGNLTVGATYTIGTQESSLPAGTEVHRTGQTSGTTKGNIEATCVSISYDAAGTILEVDCATRVDARSDPGDSGGPVYRWRIPLVTTSRSALGVLFAVNLSGDRKFWYSPMAEVITRLGSVLAY